MVEKVFEIHSLNPTLAHFCKEYFTEEMSDFTIILTQKELERERRLSALKAPDAYLEKLALCRQIALRLLDCDTLLFHGSCIAVSGAGFVFTAPSGVGKSTHTRLWREMIGSRAVMINDDKPFLRITDTGVIAYGSPWNGGHHLSTNTNVPVRGICLLQRDETNHIEPLTEEEAFPILLGQTYRPKSEDSMEKILPLVERMGRQTKLYTLGCNMESEAAWISYTKMSGTVPWLRV